MRIEQRSIDTPGCFLVTGDTHLTAGRLTLPSSLLEAAAHCDLTIHTGDFCTSEAFHLFKADGPVLAVCGNNEDRLLGLGLADAIEMQLGDRRCIITHGHLESGLSASSSVRRAYAGRYDLVIYGHSHIPEWEEADDTWFLNPGSPTQRRRAPAKTFVLLRVDSRGEFEVEFIEVEA